MAAFEACVEVEDGREISVADTAGAGRGEAPLESKDIGLLYLSRSLRV